MNFLQNRWIMWGGAVVIVLVVIAVVYGWQGGWQGGWLGGETPPAQLRHYSVLPGRLSPT